jgi:hypothetical protein
VNPSRSIALSLALAAGTIALAGPPEDARQERPDNAPGTPATFESPSIPFWERSFPFTRQTNVSPNQLNIVGDAANEPSLAVDPLVRNRIVVGWRQFDTVNSNFRQAGVARSNDGGRTWTKSTLDPGVFRSDPVLRAAPDGTIIYNSLTRDANDVFRCDLFRSGNGGQTWGAPVFFGGGDKQWMCIDSTNGPGRGNIYAHWTSYYSCCGYNNFTRSTDGGNTFLNPPLLIQSNPFWGTCTVDHLGRLYVCGSDNNVDFTVARSSNAQNAGQTPVFEQAPVGISLGADLSGFDGSSPNPGGLLGQVNIGVDRSTGPRRGRVYLLCSVGPFGADPMNVMIAHSDDGGTTWSTPRKVNAEAPGANGYQWFGTMDVAPNGRVDVAYNDTQGTGSATRSISKYTSSFDGGITWSTPIDLGPVWDSWVGWPNQQKIGDYSDIESDSVGAFLVYSATYNGEQDVYVARLGDYDCNGNGVDDTTEIAAGTSRDCDGDGIPDECEIAAGTLADSNGDGIADVCAPCAADFNGDGFLDFFDYDAFVACFEGAACPPGKTADFNNDQFVDFFDYDAFVLSFETGC